MKPYRATSILQLTLVGFCVVSLPLIVALVSALIGVDRLAKQSRDTALDATYALQSGRTLVEEVTRMERHARQFQVLKDPSLQQLYLKGHEEFRQAIQGLASLDLSATEREWLDTLVRDEQEMFDVLTQAESGSRDVKRKLDEFPRLSKLANSLLSAGRDLIRRQADALQNEADQAQNILFWQAVGLIPVALLLAGVFTILITRPLRQVDRAIKGLGAGDFSASIQINGPHDLEELGKRLEWLRKRLMELEKQKIDVLRHISHELKTPLTAIREGTELLGEGVVGPLTDDQAEIATILRNNSLKLQKRIEDLLSFSVARTPQTALDTNPVALHQLTRQVLSDQKLVTKAKTIRLETALQPVSVIGNQEQLRVILDNLVSNAVKYSPTGGKVWIDLKSKGDEIHVDVRDQGPGIPMEERTRIFEAFFQGEANPAGHVKGTGLGLAIAQEFAKLHQGTIEVVDFSAGTQMRLTLPLNST